MLKKLLEKVTEGLAGAICNGIVAGVDRGLEAIGVKIVKGQALLTDESKPPTPGPGSNGQPRAGTKAKAASRK